MGTDPPLGGAAPMVVPNNRDSPSGTTPHIKSLFFVFRSSFFFFTTPHMFKENMKTQPECTPEEHSRRA
jgi:hypothetical protein